MHRELGGRYEVVVQRWVGGVSVVTNEASYEYGEDMGETSIFLV